MDTWHIHHNNLPDIHHDEYTVDELAEILGITREHILHEIQTGALKSERIDQHTVCIRRTDSLEWLTRRGHVY